MHIYISQEPEKKRPFSSSSWRRRRRPKPILSAEVVEERDIVFRVSFFSREHTLFPVSHIPSADSAHAIGVVKRARQRTTTRDTRCRGDGDVGNGACWWLLASWHFAFSKSSEC